MYALFSSGQYSARSYQEKFSSQKPAASSLLKDQSTLLCLHRTSSSLSTSMTPRSLLLSVLVLMSFFCTVWCSPMCNNQCCRFVEDFPVRLKKLRQNYFHIRDFYVSKKKKKRSAAFTLHLNLGVSAASFGLVLAAHVGRVAVLSVSR